MGSISAQKKGNNTYYVYRETFRVKLDPQNEGNKRGTGKSRVYTRAVYLGTADKILKCIQEKREPVSISIRHFGMMAAAYQTSTELGLQEIFARHIPGQRAGIPRWIYFFLSVLNRLDHSTSKNKMGQWVSKTILPDLLGIDASKLTGNNYWYAFDHVLSERVLRLMRQEGGLKDDTFAGLPRDVFTDIERDLFKNVDQLMHLSPSAICYDTTNFYTYIEEPKRSALAHTCHSKASKHHLRHIGLLMAVERSHGVPVLSQVYQANRHDSKVFSCILADLVVALKELCGPESDLVIVIDKGNNSKANFEALSGVISWVGALVPSHHQQLIDMDLSEYHGTWKEYRYFRCNKTVMGIPCVVVLTFSSATKRKQEHSLTRGIDKLKNEIQTKWGSYKNKPTTVPKGIITLKRNNEYGNCLDVSVVKGAIKIDELTDNIKERKKSFGKNLVFSNMIAA
jgi:transposase